MRCSLHVGMPWSIILALGCGAFRSGGAAYQGVGWRPTRASTRRPMRRSWRMWAVDARGSRIHARNLRLRKSENAGAARRARSPPVETIHEASLLLDGAVSVDSGSFCRIAENPEHSLWNTNRNHPHTKVRPPTAMPPFTLHTPQASPTPHLASSSPPTPAAQPNPLHPLQSHPPPAPTEPHRCGAPPAARALLQGVDRARMPSKLK
jgi:hypothetical protein